MFWEVLPPHIKNEDFHAICLKTLVPKLWLGNASALEAPASLS
ncbi:hypothetical protein KsCSTR_44190 [Candidatus Kuenenia stuttgartiensis]|uniref:Uncharacterized protein n=1 Tax=Kuenenia stuttgartiensis TaxID=174633 RepID=A0A6G7GW28_KUEST|nr:hypothetical protein KsCSTR_44190 [Candidatus Kuenenia stuttgartiensis]